jgi:hypothetical protein
LDELILNSGELRLELEAQVKRTRDAVEAEAKESVKQADS